jgi:predicted protein tyrosine phosphatase
MNNGRIHVCSMTRVVDMVRETGARSLITILTAGASLVRPREIHPDRHLQMTLSDIDEPRDGHILPGEGHIDRLLAFLSAWERDAPLLIHCYAGVSRSPAAAYVAVCALAPHRCEMDLALALRRASPTATPNRRLIALADGRLGRQGRMTAAIAAIGRGADCYEGAPFALDVA